MGSGKTVTTCYLVEEILRLNNERQQQGGLPLPSVCYHYCGADDTGKLAYIYSSLILQLLDQHASLKVAFNKWRQATGSKATDRTQSTHELAEFFSAQAQNLKRPLYVVIDGLDECDGDHRLKLVTDFDAMSRNANKLKVLFSTRNFEDIINNQTNSSAMIELKPNKNRDGIIARHLVQRHPEDFSPAIQEQVINYLIREADGSAIWMRLTVDYIRKRNIRNPLKMDKLLSNHPLPRDLAKVYQSLFTDLTGGDLVSIYDML